MSTGSTTRLASHDDAPGSLARQIQNLAERVRALGEVTPGSFVRVEVGVSGLHSGSLHSGSIDSGNLDFLAWLRGAPVGARRYFRDRSTKLEFASVGVATTAAFGAHTSLAQVAVGGSEPRAAACSSIPRCTSPSA
jgi:hypothetical protein